MKYWFFFSSSIGGEKKKTTRDKDVYIILRVDEMLSFPIFSVFLIILVMGAV